MTSAPEQLHEAIAAYNDAWNAHDVALIGSMHAPDMVFENHTAGDLPRAHQCAPRARDALRKVSM